MAAPGQRLEEDEGTEVTREDFILWARMLDADVWETGVCVRADFEDEYNLWIGVPGYKTFDNEWMEHGVYSAGPGGGWKRWEE